MSVQKGVFPSKLKEAKVIPVYKSDDETEPGNYRPISLLSCFNRIFEKLMYHRLNSFLDKNNVLFKAQYGIREKHSTQHAILDTVNIIQNNMDFKILLFVFKSLNGLAPFYLSDLISTYVPSRSLRSASLSLLHVPGSNQKTYGDRAFAVAAPRLWNALPIQMRQPGTALDTFKRSLKTLLFKQAFYRFL